MITRLTHWIQVMPSVKGADLSLATPKHSNPPSTDDPTSVQAEPSGSILLLANGSSGSSPASDSSGVSENHDDAEIFHLPEFPLLPVSRGFSLTLNKLLDRFSESLHSSGLVPPTPGVITNHDSWPIWCSCSGIIVVWFVWFFWPLVVAIFVYFCDTSWCCYCVVMLIVWTCLTFSCFVFFFASFLFFLVSFSFHFLKTSYFISYPFLPALLHVHCYEELETRKFQMQVTPNLTHFLNVLRFMCSTCVPILELKSLLKLADKFDDNDVGENQIMISVDGNINLSSTTSLNDIEFDGSGSRNSYRIVIRLSYLSPLT